MAGQTLSTNITALTAALAASRSLESDVQRAADLIASALNAGCKLLTCGNGGSAADAMHLATEFVCRFDRDRRPYPAICFTANGSDLTAIGNDYAFEQIFARQVDAFGQAGDVLIAFTTSGKSKNVKLAIEAAHRRGVKSIAFLGKGGGDTAGLATIDLLVTQSAVTARIQEVQKLLLHTMCELIEMQLDGKHASNF